MSADDIKQQNRGCRAKDAKAAKWNKKLEMGLLILIVILFVLVIVRFFAQSIEKVGS
jgi:hypothetical protein